MAPPLTPVHRIWTPDPDGDPGKQCWEATSDDKVWSYGRQRGMPGTPWLIRHLPSGFESGEPFPSLPACRRFTASPGLWPYLAAEAVEWLAQVPEVPDPVLRVSRHDTARGFLLWLAERGLHPSATTGPVDPAPGAA